MNTSKHSDVSEEKEESSAPLWQLTGGTATTRTGYGKRSTSQPTSPTASGLVIRRIFEKFLKNSWKIFRKFFRDFQKKFQKNFKNFQKIF